MKRIFFSLSLIVVTLLACQAQQQAKASDWKEFVSRNGNFKVLFPTEPRQRTKEYNQGESKTISYWFEVEQPQKAFLLSYADYPIQQSLNLEQLKMNYDFLRDNTIKLMDAKLLNERDIFLNKYLAREVVLASGKITITHRYYMIDKRFYQVTYSIETKAIETEVSKNERNKFFDSFQLLEK